MSENIPDRVETSISLVDNTEKGATGVIKSLSKILTKYKEVEKRLSSGLSLNSNIKDYSNLANNVADNIGKKISKKVSDSINKTIKKADYYVNTIGQVYKDLNNNNLPMVISQYNLRNLPVLWSPGFELGKSYVEDYYKLSSKERLRLMKEEQLYNRNLNLPMVVQQRKYNYDDFKKDYMNIVAKEFKEKLNTIDIKSMFDRHLRINFFEEPMKQFNEKATLQAILRNGVYEVLPLNKLNLSSDLYKPKYEPNMKYITPEARDNKIINAFKNLDYYIKKYEWKEERKNWFKDYLEERNRQNYLSQKQMYFDDMIGDRLNKVIDFGLNNVVRIFKNIFSIDNIKYAIDASDLFIKLNTRVEKLNETFNKRNGTSETSNSLSDYIYSASQNSRVGYYDMINAVTNIGTYSKNTFDNQKDVVDFTNLLYKLLRTNGIDGDESLSVINQITTSMNRGVLKGYELLSLFRKAPSIVEMLTKTIKISEKELEEIASERGITSRILRNVILENSYEINKEFENIPKTWKDVAISIKNITSKTFEPALAKINELANNNELLPKIDKLSDNISKISDSISKFIFNFENIKSILIGIGSFKLIKKGLSLIKEFKPVIDKFKLAILGTKINIISLISKAKELIATLSAALGLTSTTLGGLVAVGAGALGLGYALRKYEENYKKEKFEQSNRYLNQKLKDKSTDLELEKVGTDYIFVMKNPENKNIEDFNSKELFGMETLSNIDVMRALYSNNSEYLKEIKESLKSIKDTTLDISEDDMKYLINIAERDAINRFTTAEIKVDMTNNNNINNDMDVDFIVDALAGQIEEAMYIVAEGVH